MLEIFLLLLIIWGTIHYGLGKMAERIFRGAEGLKGIRSGRRENDRGDS
jgi:hypothetical protein